MHSVIHLHNNGFGGAENINFLKTGFKVQVSEETIPLLSLYKLQNVKFVKTAKSCAYMLSPSHALM